MLPALAVLLLPALLAAGCDSEAGSTPVHAPVQPDVDRAAPAAAAKLPNVVVIITDDQDLRSFDRRYMPRTMRLLGDGGTVFESFVVATPLCCPSRASFLSGAYPHNSGVFRNHDGYQHLRDKPNTLGVWMQRAGYRTAWIGKFLQGYKNVPDPSQAAPGFDRWAVSLRAKYYDWKLFTSEGKVRGSDAPDDYFTDVLTRRAVELVDEQAVQPRPLFMVLNHLAPHRGKGASGRCQGTVAPAPGDRGRFAGERLPRPPSFNELDPDGPRLFAYDGRLDRAQITKERFRHRCRLESLLAVDRGIADLYRAFERNGELENTVFVFTSDNGLLLGEHGLTGKGVPYEEGLHVPLAIRVPQRLLEGRRVGRVGELTANVDITATILDLAGARPCWRPGDCRALDGRSLVPLIEGRASRWPDHRAIPIEAGGEGGPCGYRGLRLASSVWLQKVKMAADRGCELIGSPEYYDLAADPFQLENLAATAPARVADRIASLRRRSARLETCVGIAGREPRPGDAVPCE